MSLAKTVSLRCFSNERSFGKAGFAEKAWGKKKDIRCKELDSLHIICKTLSSSKEEIKILPNGIGN